ncbi:YidH family protein [Crocosphaera chwakensis]|uniref:DUF202 domain-containing protein n=1 Tax=Crocosphaera chwakensis CCY0110 TaxID=391612 RepID=A3IW43_9CHRO|nr:DUF202 domain-containing protein [Crocosphaera chwakensis]EAZ89278.1 hypothetical protein CY0110_08786 [Crocosphaera chwakensis CCY0110]
MTQNKMVGPTNELAKERNRAAAERTITAWIQNCLTLVGFGFAIDQIFQALQQNFPDKNTSITIESAHSISLILIAIGIGLLIIAMIQHYFEVQSIKRDDYFFYPSHYLNIIVIFAIIAFGFVSLFIIFLGIN